MSSELAFEHFNVDAPKFIWRVLYMQKLTKKSRMVRSIDYFNDEQAAYDHVLRLTERGAEVLRCDKFTMETP